MVIHCDQPPQPANAGGIRLRVLQAIALLLAAVVVLQQWRNALPSPARLAPVPFGVVTGHIVDTQGAPQAGLELTFEVAARTRLAKERSWQSWSATSNGQGRFSVALPKTRLSVRPKDRGLRDPDPLFIDLGRMPPRDLEIVVLSAAEWPTMGGMVVDEQGRPIADAEVAAWIDFGEEATATTSAQGIFELPRPTAARPGHALVSCKHDRYEWPPDAWHAWGRRDLRFVMQPRVPVEVRVVDDQGRDLAVAKISAEGDRARSSWRPPDELKRVGALWRGELWRGPAWFKIELDASIAADWYTKLAQRATVAEPSLATRFALPRKVTRTVHVVTSAGAPVANSRVELLMPQGREVTGKVMTQSPIADPMRGLPIELDAATSDTQGQVSLSGPAGTTLVVRARGPGHLPEVVANVDLTATTPLTVTVRPGARLEGRIIADPVLARLMREGDWTLRRSGTLPAPSRCGPTTATCRSMPVARSRLPVQNRASGSRSCWLRQTPPAPPSSRHAHAANGCHPSRCLWAAMRRPGSTSRTGPGWSCGGGS